MAGVINSVEPGEKKRTQRGATPLAVTYNKLIDRIADDNLIDVTKP